METKKWYFSRTLWVAVIQTVVGFLLGTVALLQSGFSQEALASFAVGCKGVFDLYLRLKTSQPISK